MIKKRVQISHGAGTLCSLPLAPGSQPITTSNTLLRRLLFFATPPKYNGTLKTRRWMLRFSDHNYGPEGLSSHIQLHFRLELQLNRKRPEKQHSWLNRYSKESFAPRSFCSAHLSPDTARSRQRCRTGLEANFTSIRRPNRILVLNGIIIG